MHMTESLLEWSATITGIFAAVTVSLNLGARITGLGFIVFTVSSVCWVVVALLSSETPLAIQNGVLFVINCVGIYRYLIFKPAGEDDGDNGHDVQHGHVAKMAAVDEKEAAYGSSSTSQ
ncbi:hypothetical protein GCM10011342_04150 [Aquisalinus flavus]|uniref:Uncharacterized protein n=2 Tax=Aquisalinus flavus TaxID=1526572 RepID=A0A8J2V4N0_9PROT|nr:hypothetical protein GCM10011342_04150 [Aquisalinus flavus]